MNIKTKARVIGTVCVISIISALVNVNYQHIKKIRKTEYQAGKEYGFSARGALLKNINIIVPEGWEQTEPCIILNDDGSIIINPGLTLIGSIEQHPK